MGNSRFQPVLGHNATTRVFSRGYVGNKGNNLAPQVGFEPTTLRLTAECSTVELLRSNAKDGWLHLTPSLQSVPKTAVLSCGHRRGFQSQHEFPEQCQALQMFGRQRIHNVPGEIRMRQFLSEAPFGRCTLDHFIHMLPSPKMRSAESLGLIRRQKFSAPGPYREPHRQAA